MGRKFKSIVDAIGNEPGIIAGSMSIRPMANGDGFWIENDEGEGQNVSEEAVEELLSAYHAENM